MTDEAGKLWQRLHDLDACGLTEIPRRSLAPGYSDRDQDGLRRQRMAALVSAYHGHASDDGLLAVGWRRGSASGGVEVCIAGSTLLGTPDGEGAVVLSLPAGAHGTALPVGAMVEAYGAVPCWQAIAGVTDGLLVDGLPDVAEDVLRPSLEDCLLGVWRGPFAWLVVAVPVSGAEIGEMSGEIADRQRRTQSRSSTSPEYAVESSRLERRLHELARAHSTGLWRVCMLAGSGSPEAARRVAALVCASADLDQLPYALVQTGEVGSLSTLLDTTGEAGGFPFCASTAMLAAVARPPAQEIPGVRFALRPDFDVTPESGLAGMGGIELGQIMDRNLAPVGALTLPRSSLNRHTFVCGATGAGKSQTIRGLLESAAHERLPFLVVEPAKAEYRFMATRLAGAAEVVAIRPGEVDAIPAGINPLEPAYDADGNRFPLQTHLDLVRALFLAAFEAQEPFPQVLSAALNRCYTELGWDLALGEALTPGVTPRYPTLQDLERVAEQEVARIGYGKEINDNVRGFIRVRLSSLRLGTTGRFFEGGHQIDFGQLLRHNVVFEIEDVGDDRDKAFLMGTVLVRLVEYLRMEQRRTGGHAVGLRHLSVFEEAHRLLRRTEDGGPAAHAVEMFAGLLAEIRAYGEGLVIAEQIPSKLLPDVIKNTAVKIVHRLPARDDRDAVGATMNITEAQSEYLVTLTPGSAAVFTDGMDYPLLTQMPDGTAREHGTTVETISPASLVTPRAVSCGPDCHRRPCTLREMRTAQRTIEEVQRIVVWAELAVLAHLTGWPTPRPSPMLLTFLRGMAVRERDCLLAHATDGAVAGRSMAVARQLSPGALAHHVSTALRAAVREGQYCKGEEPAWLAKPYRWALVRDALRIYVEKHPCNSPHPRTTEWESTYGLPVTGTTGAEQLDLVEHWFAADQSDVDSCTAVAFGTGGGLERAIGIVRTDPVWPNRLREAVGMFDLKAPWPIAYLDGKRS